MRSKILGVLYGSSVGDAMGAATALRSSRQIHKQFNGYVTTFQEPPKDVPAKGRKAGRVTDVFGIPYVLLNMKLEEYTSFSTDLGEKALLKWAEDDAAFKAFAGMTTRKVINRLKEEKENTTDWSYAGHLGNKLFKGHYYALSSNGAATKIFPIAFFNLNNLDQAINETIQLVMSSHDDKYSLSGASAVVSAMVKAFEDNVTVHDVIQAAKYGATKGEEIGKEKGLDYPGASVKKRIDMAIDLVLNSNTPEEAVANIREIIGCGPAIAETVPAAIGIFLAYRGDMKKCVLAGVNIGDETSAIASILGALCGAYGGVSNWIKEKGEFVEEVNNYHFSKLTDDIILNIEN